MEVNQYLALIIQNCWGTEWRVAEKKNSTVGISGTRNKQIQNT